MKAKEKIPLLVIYKQDGKIFGDIPETVLNLWELYGFLKVFNADLKERLWDSFE